MRAVVFHEHGDVENLRVEDIEEPSLREGDALIEVGATSINGFDPQIPPVSGTPSHPARTD